MSIFYIQVEEEYVVVDFFALVASVGGSLGLFLGFSVLDCLLHLKSRMERPQKKQEQLGPSKT